MLHKWAGLIEANTERLNALDAVGMGKPISLPAFGATAAAGFARFNAEALDKVFGSVIPTDVLSTVIQVKQPRGVVAAIVPWNFPTYNCTLKVAPAVAMGNSVVLKPSELASQSALLLAELAIEAGVPPGVFNVVLGAGDVVGRALAEHMDVDMVTFTGSTAVGRLILQYAGRSNMKAVGAECGGKSPHIVFDDGLDLDAVAANIAQMIIVNQGQVCSVGSRVLVQASVEEILVQKIIARLGGLNIGDPLNPGTHCGPLASSGQLERIMRFIESGKADGADLVCGGNRILQETGGYYVEPAVFVNVPPTSKIATEEIFGPVLSVLRFADLHEAIKLANGTKYGLAAYVWSAKTSTGFKVASALRTAVTVVNGDTVRSAGPGHGFSGEPWGLSGVGVEGGVAGAEVYLRRQTIWLNHG